jgi:hypothetical protein
MDPQLRKTYKHLSPVQQVHLARLPPEARTPFLMQIRSNGTRHANTPVTPPPVNFIDHSSELGAQCALGSKGTTRKRTSGPRKCNNPTCNTLVDKRNYCFKCQKQKERSKASSRLPSISQLMKDSSSPAQPTRPAPQQSCLPPIHAVLQNPTNISAEIPSVNVLDAKISQLRCYLLELTGSEEEATELVREYLKSNTKPPVMQSPIQSTTIHPPSSFVQQYQQPLHTQPHGLPAFYCS